MTLNNLINRLHQADKNRTLWPQITNLHSAVEAQFTGKDEKEKRKILDDFFSDPSKIQQKINAALPKEQ